MIERIIGVFKLSASTFEEIENDTTATSQAFIIVAIVALLSAIGGGIGFAIQSRSFLGGFISTLIWAFVGYVLWSATTYYIGTTFFGGKATFDEMLRVIGFAYAPQVLSVIPCVGWLIGGVWSLVAGFIAVRQGLDIDNQKTALTVAVGFVIFVIGNSLLNMLFR